MVAVGAGSCQPCGVVFAHLFDLAEPKSQREAAVAVGFHRVVPEAGIDADRADLNAMFAGIPHDLRGGVEAHWLGIEQSAGKDAGVVAF